MSDNGPGKHDVTLAHLVGVLEMNALQQLGKLGDPATGEAKCDLEQARFTIDILDMLKAKCRAGTPEDLLRHLDSVVLNMQLNYMDELKKAQKAQSEEAAGTAAPEPDQEPDDGQAEA
jgi:hypothetical protein